MTDEFRVLIVDDNDGCRELYSLWVPNECTVSTATDGTDALEIIDERTDVVFLDRNMSGLTGKNVAARINEAGYDCSIVMVSSEEQDFEILDSSVESYLRKPVDRTQIQSTVRRVADRQAYESAVSEYFHVSETVAKLEADSLSARLDRLGAYLQLKKQVQKKRAEISRLLEESELDWQTAFKSFEDTSISQESAGDTIRPLP